MDINAFNEIVKNSQGGKGNEKTFTYYCDGVNIIVSQKAQQLHECIKTLSYLLSDELKKAKIEKA